MCGWVPLLGCRIIGVELTAGGGEVLLKADRCVAWRSMDYLIGTFCISSIF
jgi:hypothetical protein